MPLELTGAQRKELRKALLDAFPSWNELERMLADELDWRLAEITAAAAPLQDNAFDLIEWARARGWLAELIIAARNERPNNAKLERFAAMEKLAASVALSSSAAIPASNLEKVVTGNAVFLDVARWAAGLIQAEWRVCRVECRGEGAGTGFLVGPDLVLTNHHVVEGLLATPADAPIWGCRFDHKLSPTGTVTFMGRAVKLADPFCVDSSPPSPVDLEKDPKSGDPGEDQLDFALLRLAEPVGDQPVGASDESAVRGFIPLPAAAADFDRQRVVAILGHPLQRPMKLSLDLDQHLVMNGARNRVRYTVPTDSGSSGSPVFDSDWNLVALHHGSDPKRVNPAYNEGIPIGKIAARPKVAAALPK